MEKVRPRRKTGRSAVAAHGRVTTLAQAASQSSGKGTRRPEHGSASAPTEPFDCAPSSPHGRMVAASSI
jgi:hypothetical protein